MANQPSERNWRVDADDFGEVNPDELAQVALDVATVVRMVGGVATMGAHREEVRKDEFVTTAVLFHWQSFVPARRLKPRKDRPEEPYEPTAAEAEPEPEPVAAEG